MPNEDKGVHSGWQSLAELGRSRISLVEVKEGMSRGHLLLFQFKPIDIQVCGYLRR
jgi:hypothetical protein